MSDLPPSSEFRVDALDKIVPAYAKFDGKMFAGTLPMNNGKRTGETMFWLFEPRKQMVENSIVIWLNGGPVSSEGSFILASTSRESDYVADPLLLWSLSPFPGMLLFQLWGSHGEFSSNTTSSRCWLLLFGFFAPLWLQ